MRIITLNANGIRSAARKGFFDWLGAQDADVVCLQETKAQVDQLADSVFRPQGYHCYYFDAEKKGYSGVALYSRVKPQAVVTGFGSREFDAEGRYLEAQFKGLSVVSVYLPSGSSSEERQQAKFRFLEQFMPHLRGAQAPAARLRAVRRLEHRPQGDRPEELALQPEELRLPAGGARLARRAVRRRGLRRRLPRGGRAARPVHLVVEPRPGLGEERRAGASTTRC